MELLLLVHITWSTHLKLPTVWLQALSSVPYPEAREALLQLSGVGAKVADCICLFALGMHDVVPLDKRTAQFYLRKDSHS